MRPTLRQLEYIVAVARHGRFGVAAAMLNVSQPSLSAQISEVEADLGTRLFQRGRSGVRLTASGTEVVRRAQKILREVEDLRASVTSGLPFGGRLRLGVLPSIGPYLLPRAIASIHRQHPGLRVSVREENTQSLEQGLRSARFDVIVSTPEDHPNTRQVRLFGERLWIAVARDDPLAASESPVVAEDLRGRVFLTLDRGHRLSRIVHALASACGGIVSDDYEGTSLDSVRLMSASGAGIAILPELYAREQAAIRRDVALRLLHADGASREIALLQLAGADEDGLDLIRAALLDAVAALGLAGSATDTGPE